MAEYLIQDTTLLNISNAIREKTGNTELLTPEQMVAEIQSITTNTEIYAIINVAYPNGSTCTCTNGETTLRATTNDGKWTFPIPYAGTWTVSSTDGSQSDSENVSIINEWQIETVTLDYAITATIRVTYPAKSSCSIRDSSGTTIVSDTNTGSSAKTWTATVNKTGSYTVYATLSGSSVYTSRGVSVTANGQSQNVTLTYKTTSEYIFKAGTGAVLNLYNSSNPTTQISSSSISFTSTSSTGFVRPYSTINLTNVSTIYADVLFTAGSANTSLQAGIIVFPERYGVGNGSPADPTKGPNQGSAYVYFPVNGVRQTVSVNVTNLSGDYFVGLYGRSVGNVYNFYYTKFTN